MTQKTGVGEEQRNGHHTGETKRKFCFNA